MKLYAVFQEGVYRHTCCGIYDTIEAAKAGADKSAETDSDDYHTYDVVDFELNAFESEGDVLYSVRKRGGRESPT